MSRDLKAMRTYVKGIPYIPNRVTGKRVELGLYSAMEAWVMGALRDGDGPRAGGGQAHREDCKWCLVMKDFQGFTE